MLDNIFFFDNLDPTQLRHVKGHRVDSTSGVLADLAEGEMVKSDPFYERRGRSRVILALPLDYRLEGSCFPCAGIVRNGSETGLLISSRRDIPVGAKLDVDVLFVDEYELSHFEGRVRVVRTIRLEDAKQGYQHGVKFFRIDEVNYRKLKRLLLSCREETVDGGSWLSVDITEERSLPTLDAQDPWLTKKRSLLERFLLSLLRIR